MRLPPDQDEFMSRPLVSCIVPVYNGERFLSEALDSIFAQSYRPLEIIVVDDGSTDGSPSIVASYGTQVQYIRQLDQGPAETRNVGLRNAIGQFIAFLDQDDLWHGEKLERQMVRFQARPELDVCVAHASLLWVSTLRQEELRLRGCRRGSVVPAYTTGALVARRRAFDRVGELDSTLWFGDATDWFLRAAEEQLVIELLPDVLLYHRMHDSNLSRRRVNASRDEFLRIVKASLGRRRSAKATVVSYQFPVPSFSRTSESD